MGRMKEIHIDMLNAQWEGDPNEFLEMHIKQQEYLKREILCPNCMTDNLIPTEEENELNCMECGYDFIRLDYNTVRYK